MLRWKVLFILPSLSNIRQLHMRMPFDEEPLYSFHSLLSVRIYAYMFTMDVRLCVPALKILRFTNILESTMNELPICTKIDEYLLICVCSGSQLLVLVMGNGQFWRNVFTDHDLQSSKTHSTMTVEQYKYKLLSALKLHPTDPQFTVERLDSSLQILWSKEVKKGIQVNFGTLSLPVSESPMQNIQEVVEALANQVRQLNEQNSRVMEEHEKLRKTADAAVQKYDQLVADTETREVTLLKHFVEVLNEKKRKIAELQGSQTSPTPRGACLTKDTSKPEPLAKSFASEDSLDDGEELLPKIPRTSKSVLSRAFPARRGRKSKTVKSIPKLPATSSCSATNASLDELLDSL